MASQKLQYVFGAPQYPVLCSVPGDLISASSLEQLEERLSQFDLPANVTLDVIDATGENFMLDNEQKVVAPFSLKSWTKAELLNLYRESATGRRCGLLLDEKKLLRKRLDVLILAIVELLREGPRTQSLSAEALRPGSEAGTGSVPPPN